MTVGVATRSWERRMPLRERDFLFCWTAMMFSFSERSEMICFLGVSDPMGQAQEARA